MPISSFRRPLGGRSFLLGAVLTAVLLITGCGAPPWQQGAPASPATDHASTPTRSSTPASPSPTLVQNDLAKGSLKHRLTAGGIALEATYYSTLSLQKWTPQASKPLTVSVSARFPDGSKQDIFLSDVEVRIDVLGLDGPLPGPEPLTDQASVSPGYLIRSPNAYGQVFTIPALPVQARAVRLNITYRLLAPTAPKAKTYFKQSTNDTLTLTLVS